MGSPINFMFKMVPSPGTSSVTHGDHAVIVGSCFHSHKRGMCFTMPLPESTCNCISILPSRMYFQHSLRLNCDVWARVYFRTSSVDTLYSTSRPDSNVVIISMEQQVAHQEVPGQSAFISEKLKSMEFCIDHHNLSTLCQVQSFSTIGTAISSSGISSRTAIAASPVFTGHAPETVQLRLRGGTRTRLHIQSTCIGDTRAANAPQGNERINTAESSFLQQQTALDAKAPHFSHAAIDGNGAHASLVTRKRDSARKERRQLAQLMKRVKVLLQMPPDLSIGDAVEGTLQSIELMLRQLQGVRLQ